MRIALYQPDIAGNVGTILRLAACWQVAVDIILPCGFPASDAQLRRAAMDYGDAAEVTRHADFEVFAAARLGNGARLVALTSAGDTSLYEAQFDSTDVLLLGRESAGLPETLRAQADMRVRIPMAEGFRSLNLAVASGIALGEAMRQTALFPQFSSAGVS
jgi:tRNA (cytidine/uridine-2'-O-)-methyltransferase